MGGARPDSLAESERIIDARHALLFARGWGDDVMYLVRRMAWTYPLLVLLAMVLQPAWTASADQSSLRSKEGNIETAIDFMNSMDEPIAIYWIDYDGKKKLYATLRPGEKYSQHTYVTHLIKFELPWSEFKDLLRRLANAGVNASTVFPGYYGVVDAVREKLWWWDA